jgi:peroxiredoxin
MAKTLTILIAVCYLLFFGCSPKSDFSRLSGQWQFELTVGGQQLPFIVHFMEDSTLALVSVHNAEERIVLDDVKISGDSLLVRFPVFNTAIHAKLASDSLLTGEFIDFSRKSEYRIPLIGRKGQASRFERVEDADVDISGKWSVGFSPNTPEAYPAIGKFAQTGNLLTGTFLTTTGDFRFLEGVVSGDSLFLSGFDGSFAMLFKARVHGDSITGRFWSGRDWSEQWMGYRNPLARLPDPETLTNLLPGQSKMAFTFPDLNGQLVSLSDARFEGQVVIVQIMGSWCPNCLDETRYLIDLYGQHEGEGLEIVALAFERGNNDEERIRNLTRLRDHLSIPYPILLAGSASKSEASAKLPMLNHVIAFPTTVVIDRKGRVRRIHTGFSGPGTGDDHTAFIARTEALIEKLIEEKVVF